MQQVSPEERWEWDAQKMAQDIQEAARKRGLPIHKALKQMGCHTGLYNRLNAGKTCNVDSAIRVLRWLGEGATFEDYIKIIL